MSVAKTQKTTQHQPATGTARRDAAAEVRRPAVGKIVRGAPKVHSDFSHARAGTAVAAPQEHVPIGRGLELGAAAPDDRSFATSDAAASRSLATLGRAFADPKFCALLGDPAKLTTADLTSIAKTGTLRGQQLAKAAPALAADLATAAQFLTARSHAPYLHPLVHT